VLERAAEIARFVTIGAELEMELGLVGEAVGEGAWSAREQEV
jgi:hypothetical protein